MITNFKNKILEGDCIEIMKELPDESFDFCFADPPYFMQIEEGKKLFRVEGTVFDGCDDEWDKFPSMNVYKEFTRKWLLEVKRLLKKDGSICVISGMQSIYEIGSILRELGYWVINDIIWEKSNPTPNFGGTRLNNSHETLIWASKSKNSKFHFNYKTGKVLNDGKQMGSIWKFPVFLSRIHSGAVSGLVSVIVLVPVAKEGTANREEPVAAPMAANDSMKFLRCIFIPPKFNEPECVR